MSLEKPFQNTVHRASLPRPYSVLSSLMQCRHLTKYIKLCIFRWQRTTGPCSYFIQLYLKCPLENISTHCATLPPSPTQYTVHYDVNFNAAIWQNLSNYVFSGDRGQQDPVNPVPECHSWNAWWKTVLQSGESFGAKLRDQGQPKTADSL